jgi:hypothetical protein
MSDFQWPPRLPSNNPSQRYIPGLDDNNKKASKRFFRISAILSLTIGILVVIFAAYITLRFLIKDDVLLFSISPTLRRFSTLALIISDAGLIAGLIGLKSDKKVITLAGVILNFLAGIPILIFLTAT